MEKEKIDTLFMSGLSITLPFDKGVWGLSIYNRDEWSRSWLKNHKIRVLRNTYLVRVYEGNSRPLKMRIMNFDYKEQKCIYQN